MFQRNSDIYTVAYFFSKIIFFSYVYQIPWNIWNIWNMSEIIEEFPFQTFWAFQTFLEHFEFLVDFKDRSATKSNQLEYL